MSIRSDDRNKNIIFEKSRIRRKSAYCAKLLATINNNNIFY